MTTRDQIVEVNDRLVESGFPYYRETLWDHLGDMPLRTAVRLLLATHRQIDKLSIVDVGCGCGDDLMQFRKLLRLDDYLGEIHLYGCDLSPEMVRVCSRRKLEGVVIGDFLDDSPPLPPADLLWCHFVLVHVTPDELRQAVNACAALANPNAIVGFGFKTGDNETRLDPADASIPIDRTMSFHRPDTVSEAAACSGLAKLAEIQVPADSSAYDYCWLITRKSS